MENHFLWKLLKLTIKNWRHDKISLYAAALAYYTAFSITPFLVICISVVGLLVGDNAAESEILTHISHLLGLQSTQNIAAMINSIQKPYANIWAGVIGVGLLIIGVLGLFTQLKAGLNHIWNITPKRT